jgi:hypothetical protein
MPGTKKIAVDWEIKNMDTGELFRPPYPVSSEGVRVQGVGGVYAEMQRFGMDPVSNWISGKTKTYQFTTVLFAETTDDNIEAKFSMLTKWASKDEDLGRPPICIFTYGNADVMVLIEEVSPIIRPPRSDGSSRLIDLDIVLRKYKPFSQIQIDPNKPNKESYYLVMSATESSYESIAKKYYGSAIAGDRLRKRHPSMPMQPTVGTKVHLPSKSIILREVVQPDYHAFNLNDEDATYAFRELLDARSSRKVIL